MHLCVISCFVAKTASFTLALFFFFNSSAMVKASLLFSDIN